MNVEIDYKPHEKQLKFHNDRHKFRLFLGGVGSGKTKAGAYESIMLMLNYPNSRGVIIAPTYSMLQDVVMHTFFSLCPKDLILEHNKTEHRVKFLNGADVLFRSADEPEKLRGTNIDWFWMDECSLEQYHMVWLVMIARIRNGRLDAGFITTTPKGFNWLYNEFKAKMRPQYSIINCATRDNKYLPEDFIVSLEETYTGVFAKQELLGEFIGFEGLVYPEFSTSRHVMLPEIMESRKFSRVIAGVDWGYSISPAVILVIGIDGEGAYYLIDEFYQKRVLLDDIMRAAKDLQFKYGIERFFCDPSKPEYIQEFLRAGLQADGTKSEVLFGIQRVASMLATKGNGLPMLYVSTKCVNTIMEFQNYRFPEAKEGVQKNENPLKIFDHAMDALRYCVKEEKIELELLTDTEGLIFQRPRSDFLGY